MYVQGRRRPLNSNITHEREDLGWPTSGMSRDGSTVGGHVQRLNVWPTLEIVITETPKRLAKRVDDETGLTLIGLDEP